MAWGGGGVECRVRIWETHVMGGGQRGRCRSALGDFHPHSENSRALPSSSFTTHNGCSPLGKVRRSPAHTPCADPATGSQSILLSVRPGVAHPDRPHAHLPATVIGAGVWLQSSMISLS